MAVSQFGIHLVLAIVFWVVSSFAMGEELPYLTVNQARDFVTTFLVKSTEIGASVLDTKTDEELLELFLDQLERKPNKSLLLTDIDDTLLESKYIFTTSKYFKFGIPRRRLELQREYPDLSDGEREKIIDDEFWKYVGQFKDVEVLDAFYRKLIDGLQTRGHMVLALTARPERLVGDTQNQFSQVQLKLGLNVPRELQVSDPGVLFAPKTNGRSTKGKALIEFLERAKTHAYQFSHLFFFDDNQPDIDSVAESLQQIRPLFPSVETQVVKTKAAEFFAVQKNLANNLEKIGDLQLEEYRRSGKMISNAEALKALAAKQLDHEVIGAISHLKKTDYNFLTERSIFGFANKSDDADLVAKARSKLPNGTPSDLAELIPIGPQYKDILKWMESDLRQYLENFDDIFESKLSRIKLHHEQRLRDRESWLEPMRKRLEVEPNNSHLQREIERMSHELKPHGFAHEYSDASDFVEKFVGPRGKLLKMNPGEQELSLMNRVGTKRLYADTWAVPFFNTGTQTKEQARQGVEKVLSVFASLKYDEEISFRQFTELASMFARPEFDDVRRYKMQLFPSRESQHRYRDERSDALVAGQKFPEETFVFINEEIGLDPLSYTFGLRTHGLGFISHQVGDALADGRVFTGPADFMEHDYSHAFFNLAGMIPGTILDWQRIHEDFFDMKSKIPDPALRRMMSLVYFHLTHESGFKTLMPQVEGGDGDHEAYQNLINDIREKTKIRFYYDWIPRSPSFNGQFDNYLEKSFKIVADYFKPRILELIQRKHLSDESFRSGQVRRCKKSLNRSL